VTLVLRESVRARRDAEVTKRLNELFANRRREPDDASPGWDSAQRRPEGQQQIPQFRPGNRQQALPLPHWALIVQLHVTRVGVESQSSVSAPSAGVTAGVCTTGVNWSAGAGATV
jgi:hypothetical protein